MFPDTYLYWILRRIFGSEGKEITGGWRKLHTANKELHNCIPRFRHILIMKMIKKMDWASCTHARDEEYVQNFSSITRMEETIEHIVGHLTTLYQLKGLFSLKRHEWMITIGMSRSCHIVRHYSLIRLDELRKPRNTSEYLVSQSRFELHTSRIHVRSVIACISLLREGRDVEELGRLGVGWVELTRGSVQLRPLLSMAMNLSSSEH